MKIGFIGQGWIGKNYADVFEKKGHAIVRYGLEEEFKSNKAAVFDCEIVFIAVPTPTTAGRFDPSAVISALSILKPGTTAVIKSTLLPNTTKNLQKEFPFLFIFHSPEFLREKTAKQDAEFPERNIIGTPDGSELYLTKAKHLLSILPKAKYNTIIGSTEAELVKYAGNCYLYQKVVFFNQLHDLADSLGSNYEHIREAVTNDSRIPESHTHVIHASGHTPDIKKRGAGGHCFIKDYEAYTNLYKNNLPTDREGIAILENTKNKNYSYLRESGKDLELLESVEKKSHKFVERIKTIFQNNKESISALLLCSAILLFSIISQQGIYNIFNDTTVYKNQILFYEGELEDVSSIQYHFFKPLYGVLGSMLYPSLSTYGSIFLINIIFYIGLVLGFYFLLKKIGFKEELSFLGALWVASGYPLLKYGLALLTDISGWFFTTITLLIFLIAKDKKYNPTLLILASVFGFIGSLAKETGVLGLVAATSFVAISIILERKRESLKALLVLTIPALLLQTGLLLLTLSQSNKTIVDWISFNIKTNTSETFHSFYYFSFTEIATFHILWVYGLVGLFYYLRKKIYKNKALLLLGVSLFIGTLPVLFWPLFYIRIFYIQYIIVIPLALFGFKQITDTYQNKILYYTLAFIPIIISMILFVTAGKSSLFDILSTILSAI
ncbi:MAG: hypothetical protein RI935_739 [Candidatus Parcubacteria bacterium]|jgi:hypothetical protein